MTNWAGGYVSDIPYTSDFYREMAPVSLYLAALLRNVRPPAITAPYNYCELACGQGVGTMLLAAANPQGRFYGYDFSPGMIRNAESLLVESGLKNCVIGEESFASLCEKSDSELPMFDFIALHGTYTWVDAERRREIVQFVGKRLKPGGLFYISWNCMPGWTPMLAAQRMMVELARRVPGRTQTKIEHALGMLRQLNENNAKLFAANPDLGLRLKTAETQDRAYLAHEFFNDTWEPLYVTDVMRDLADAKLSFVGSAQYGEMYDEFVVPPELLALLNDAPDAGMRELLRDMAVNAQFRRDLYVRGEARLPAIEQRRLLGELGVVLSKPADKIELAVKLMIGDADLPPALYAPIVAALASGAKTIDELDSLPAMANQSFNAVLQCAVMLVHTGQAALVPPRQAAGARSAVETSRALNLALAMRTRYGEDPKFLAAGKTGSAIGTNVIDRLLYPILLEPTRPSPSDLAAFVVGYFRQTGRQMLQHGAPVASIELETVQQVNDLLQTKLPVWRELGVL
ncbi:class I SAM-dependent methyltransferase [Roseiterribacter gracilis]|uniref:Methyltransferase domain-containing protein n=1 Tax=Roseiterribacter gracilis TaxID=2812848 RepID=A0A8S8XC37_9PROT|nr:hypothetical protein TMPK1_11020 [Rhodospirillales bacterium TMPK1]